MQTYRSHVSRLGAGFILALSLSMGLSAQSNPLGYDYVRTDVQSVSTLDRVLAYDSSSHITYAVNPQLNRIDVISLTTHSLLGTIDVPQPTSVDISADGTKLIIGTNNSYFYTADSATGQLTGRFSYTIQIPNQTNPQQLSPVGVTYLSDGTALIRSQLQFSGSIVVHWDPVAGTVTTTPFSTNPISNFNGILVARSGDHKKALLVGSNQIQLYDVATNSIIATKSYGGSANLTGATLNFDGSRIFVGVNNSSSISPNFISELDSSLIELLEIPVNYGSRFFLISADGSTLYLARPPFCCGGFAITIERRDANPNSPTRGQRLAGGDIPDISFLGYDNTNTSISEISETGVLIGFNRLGVAFIDPSKATLFDPAATPPTLGYPTVLSTRAAPLNTSVQTGTNGGFSFTPLVSAYFGNTAATNIQPVFGNPANTSTLTGFTMDAPASSQPGPVNLVARFDSGWTALAPLAFTYGPKVVATRGTAGSPAGGDSITILGYGFGDVSSTTVTIGGNAATVQSIAVGAGGFDLTPLQQIVVTTPSGSGTVDVTVTSNAGSATVKNGFTYVQDIQKYSNTGPMNFLAYDAGRKRVYISNSAKIEAFDVQGKQFLTPLQPSTIKANTTFQGLTLTLDGTKLIAADSGEKLVHIIDPVTGTASAVSTANLTPGISSGPTQVAALSNGQILVSIPNFGTTCQGCLLLLNLATNSLTPIFDPAFSNLFNGINLTVTRDGSRVLLADGILYDGANNFVITGANTGLSAPFSISDDGSTYFSASNVVASLPDFQRQNALTDSLLLFPPSSGMNALDPSGGLVFLGSSSSNFATLSNAIDIWDTHSGRSRLRIAVPDQIANQFGSSSMASRQLITDDTGRTLFAVTTSSTSSGVFPSLTVINLASLPLTVAHLNPPIGSNAAGETVTVLGAGFQQGATLKIGANTVAATVVSDRTITFQDPGLPNGSYPVTVTNPDGQSYTLQLGFTSAVPNPAPILNSIAPNSQAVLNPFNQNQPITLVVTGSSFIDKSVVMWNGNPLPTVFVSATELHATISGNLLTRAQIAQVSVFNPLPDGGSSSFVPFTVIAPAPILNPPQSPIILFTNDGDKFISLSGAGFISQSVALWDGTTRLPTGFSSPTSLFVTVPASLLTTAGDHSITVVNPTPGGGTSNAITVSAVVPQPQISGPSNVFFGATAIGVTSSQSLFISTGTPATVLVGTVSISAADFKITADTCSNATLQRFQSCSITVTFSPTISGARSGSIAIPSNDPASPFIVTLQGTGDQPPIIKLSVTPAGGQGPPLVVTASTAGSSDPDGSISSSRFDFGDGSFGFLSGTGSMNHTYTHPGTFTLTAAVFDDFSISAVTSVLVDVLNGVADVPVPGDYDGDGKADVAVWRPGTGQWYIIRSSTGQGTVQQWGGTFGGVQDVPVPGDYDGDGKTDIAIWRPGTGQWFIIPSSTGQGYVVQWGATSNGVQDVPVPRDYDGDGKTDIAIWRPGTGQWYIIRSSTGQGTVQQWGGTFGGVQDVPVPGDYDGDGKADVAIWRPGTGQWYIIQSSTGQGYVVQWGGTFGGVQDVPVAGDYDGDRKADIAIWRPGTGQWYIIRSSTGQGTVQQWGGTFNGLQDVPVARDYDRDRKADVAIWRPGTGQWYIIQSSTGQGYVQQWGGIN